MNSFQTAERTAVLLALLAAALVFSVGSAMSQSETIWSEDFTGDAPLPSNTTSLTGGKWSASSTPTSGNKFGNMSVTADGLFLYDVDGGNFTATCVWTSEPIDVASYSSYELTQPIVQQPNNSTAAVSGVIEDLGGNSVRIVYTIVAGGGDNVTIDNIGLDGVCSSSLSTFYADTDGDGLGDPNSSILACSQPDGYVANNNDDDPNLNPGLYRGTLLSPGDVYMSYAAENYDQITTSYIGFTLLVDVLGGTELVVSPSLLWDGDSWALNSGTTAYKWVAPEGGVIAGTEVILSNTGTPTNSQASGMAYRDNGADRVTRASGNLALTGGVQCGSWTQLGTQSDFFTWDTPVSWAFQPDTLWSIGSIGTPQNDGKCRHLHSLGYDLAISGNTGAGTLIEGLEVASMDLDFAFQSSIFQYSSQWSYAGGNELIPFANNSNVLTPRTIKELVAFSSAGAPADFISTTSQTPDYDALDFDPNGSINIPDSLTWSQLFSSVGVAQSGGESLDFMIDNGYTCSIDVAPEDGSGVNFQNLAVNAGSFIGCDGLGRTVGVLGNITLGETGAFVGGRGQLRLRGANAQIIDANNYSDASSTKMRLNSVKVENNKTASIKGHVRLKPGGHLEFDPAASSDQLALDGTVASTLTFESDATGTAAIAACAASNFGDGANQQFTFERYIPADPNSASWVNIGAYVTGTTVADWTAANPSMLIFKYNESNYGSQSAGWSYLWDASTELLPGSGYMAMLPQGQDAQISVTGAFKMGDVPITLTFTDDPNQSNVTVDGWNLVSNPYPAPVNMQQVLAGTGISTWYVFDNQTADAYIAGGSDAPSVLDVGQSMWIKVSAETVITFSEEDKVTDNTGTFVREFTEEYAGTVGMQVSNASDNLARAFVKFQANTSAAFDIEHDALMYNSTGTADLGVWMVAESGEKLSRQAAGLIGEVSTIPLKVNSGAGGLTSFHAYNHPETPDYTCVVIEDTETGERAQLGVDTLSVDLPANTHFADRFLLHFTPAPSMTWQSTACDGLEVELTGEAWETWDATWTANDGSTGGTGFPNELEDGDYTFEFTLVEAGCLQSVAVTVETACLGDFNLNGERDIVDLLVILAGLPGGTLATDFAEEADCDCDGAVTVNDMLTFLTVFATPCE